MQVADLMTQAVQTCRPDDTLDRAAAVMWNADFGSVPVVDDLGRVVGMITDRDVCMAAYTQGVALSAARVESAMAKNPICCAPGDMAATAEHLMQVHNVRRLPVVDAQRRLLGIVSLADIAYAMATRQTFGADGMTWHALGHTLAAICTPRHFVPPADEEDRAAE